MERILLMDSPSDRPSKSMKEREHLKREGVEDGTKRVEGGKEGRREGGEEGGKERGREGGGRGGQREGGRKGAEKCQCSL